LIRIFNSCRRRASYVTRVTNDGRDVCRQSEGARSAGAVKHLQVVLCRVIVVCSACVAFACHASQRRFSVPDSIDLVTFETPMTRALVPAPEVSFAPDSAHFVVVTIRGVLSSNRRVATMWLFDAADVRAYLRHKGKEWVPHARILLRCASASNQLPISFWRWSGDSRSILFLRADDDGVEHLERVSLDGGEVAKLSRAGQDVTGFDEQKGHVVYLAHGAIKAGALYEAGGASLPDIEDGTGESMLKLVFPNWMRSVLPTRPGSLYQFSHGVSAAVLSSNGSPILLGGAYVPDTVRQKLAIAPSGRRVLATAYVEHIPKSWERYRSPFVSRKIASFGPDTSRAPGSRGVFYPQEYVLLNIENAKLSPLIDAPIEFDSILYSPTAGAWSADESRVAIPGVFAPIRRTVESSGTGAVSDISPCAVAVIVLASRRFSCLQSEADLEASDTPFWLRKRVISLRWVNGNRTVIATYATLVARNSPVTIRYTEDEKGGWSTEVAASLRRRNGLRVYVEQALNKSPVLIASLPVGARRTLLNPNPQLRDIPLGTASVYRWAYDGKLRKGVLVTPPGFSPHSRYPLVIQAESLNLAEFLVDGPSHTAFAARALAARDIVVLEVPDIGEYASLGWQEENAANYRAAIQQLARSGVIDRRRVGIIGWSHSGVFVLQSLEDDPSMFSAASIAEGSSNSYSEFLAQVDYWSGTAGEKYLFHYVGAWPWGGGLKVWLARSPGFHTDRICAPVLYQVTNPAALVFQSWDDYAILRAQRKPVDFLYIRNGAHELIKPRERLADQQMNVDWFDYWLNGRKSSRPAIAGEYRRWDVMRKALPICPASETN
jgi:dienelactone hydrolase